jgi:VCBS repeat-containing protein
VTSATGNLGALSLAADGQYTYTVANSATQSLGGNDTKTDTFTIASADGTHKDVSFTVHGVNDAPVVGTLAASAAEGSASVTIDALNTASDADAGTVLRVVNLPTSLPAGVSYNADTHSFTIDPSVSAYDYLAAGQSTTVTVTYGVSDRTATTAQTVSFTVNGTNDSASIGAPTVTDVTEDALVNVSGKLTAVGAISISDVDQGQSIFNTVVTSATGNIGALFLTADGQYTYTVANSATQSLGGKDTKTDTFSITSADGTRKDVSFTVHGVNDAPTVTPGSTTATEDGALVVFDALTGANDADANTTLIVPSTMSEVSSLIGSAMKMVQATK